jgi:hypothetical protein
MKLDIVMDYEGCVKCKCLKRVRGVTIHDEAGTGKFLHIGLECGHIRRFTLVEIE